MNNLKKVSKCILRVDHTRKLYRFYSLIYNRLFSSIAFFDFRISESQSSQFPGCKFRFDMNRCTPPIHVIFGCFLFLHFVGTHSTNCLESGFSWPYLLWIWSTISVSNLMIYWVRSFDSIFSRNPSSLMIYLTAIFHPHMLLNTALKWREEIEFRHPITFSSKDWLPWIPCKKLDRFALEFKNVIWVNIQGDKLSIFSAS